MQLLQFYPSMEGKIVICKNRDFGDFALVFVCPSDFPPRVCGELSYGIPPYFVGWFFKGAVPLLGICYHYTLDY